MATSGAGWLLFGKLFDRFGVAVYPADVVSIASAPLVFLGGFRLALTGAALWGLGMGVHESIIPAAVAAMVPVERRPSAYGLFTAAYGTFWFLGSAAIGSCTTSRCRRRWCSASRRARRLCRFFCGEETGCGVRGRYPPPPPPPPQCKLLISLCGAGTVDQVLPSFVPLCGIRVIWARGKSSLGPIKKPCGPGSQQSCISKLPGGDFFFAPYYQDTKSSPKNRQNSLRVLWWKWCGMRGHYFGFGAAS